MNTPGLAARGDVLRMAQQATPAPARADAPSAPFVLPDAAPREAARAEAPRAERRHAVRGDGSTALDPVRDREATPPGESGREVASTKEPAGRAGRRATEPRADGDGRARAPRADDTAPSASAPAGEARTRGVGHHGSDDEPPSDTAEGARAAATADATPPPPATAPDLGAAVPGTPGDTALPARMLALLGAPVGASMQPPGTTGPLAPGALAGAVAPDTASAAPGQATLLATAAAGSGLPSATATLTPPAPGLPGGVATAAGVASSGGDAFAALAALAQGAHGAATGDAPRLERIDAPPPLDALGTGPDAAAPPLPGARTAVDTARVQFAAPIALPAQPGAAFDDAFDQRIVWLAEQRIGQAEMRVSPDGMGPIDVRLQVDGHRVSAQFHAANADVRQALEAGMDRLRDLLGQRGMELADAQVGQQRSQGGQPGTAFAGSGDGGAEGEAAPVTTLRALRARGLVDEYA